MFFSETEIVKRQISREANLRKAWRDRREDWVHLQLKALRMLEDVNAGLRQCDQRIDNYTARIDRLVDLLPRQREGD